MSKRRSVSIGTKCMIIILQIRYKCTSVDGYVVFSHYSYLYLHIGPTYTLRRFGISLLSGINKIVSASNNTVKVRILPRLLPFILL